MGSYFQDKIIILFFYIALICLSLGSCHDPKTDIPYILDDQIKASIKNGDIILRMGIGIISETIKNVLADSIEISHCGILIKEKDSISIIHSLSKEISGIDGLQECTIDQFCSESIENSIIIVRFRNDSNQVLSQKAQYYLSIHKPFDNAFNIRDTSAFFCSELPLHIIKYELETNLYDPYSKIPKFSVFLDSIHFEKIYPVSQEIE